jgi:hypothetical protein
MLSYTIRKARKLGLDVHILVITAHGKVVHESSHMSQAGAVTRLLQYRNKGE